MKDYMLLRWSRFNYYRHISDYVSSSNLRFLINFFSGDYRSDDKDLFNRMLSCYDASFVYNNFADKIFYIGSAEWELDEEIDAPRREEFSAYVNESNSYKITHDNFIELAEKLMHMKKNSMPFAVIYRNDNDWVNCKGFETQQAMEAFVQQAQQEAPFQK